VLRAAGPRIYGYDATNGRLMVSGDGGRTWQQRRTTAPLIDLAVDPANPDRILGSSEAGLAVSRDAGRSWRRLRAGRPGLMTWTDRGVALVDGKGRVHQSTDGGRTWNAVGDVGGPPAAMSAHDGELLVALHSNAVMASADGGRTWTLRIEP
jgi:photosystem II stability/assembly factor-like uncharacterized protein